MTNFSDDQINHLYPLTPNGKQYSGFRRIALQFHWLRHADGKQYGFMASASTELGDTIVYENLYEPSHDAFKVKYPTLQHILLAISKTDTFSGNKKFVLAIESIENNCNLYPLEASMPALVCGDTPELNGDIDVNNSIFDIINSEKYTKHWRSISQATPLSLNVLRTYLRDGTPTGITIETTYAEGVVITDMTPFQSKELFLQEYPTIQSFLEYTAEHPLWAENGSKFQIDMISMNEKLWDLPRSVPQFTTDDTDY